MPQYTFAIRRGYGEAEADIRRRVEAKEVAIGFGHPARAVADPRNKAIMEVSDPATLARGVRQRAAATSTCRFCRLFMREGAL